MEYPKISIVTPSFNQGQYIGEAIESVLNQGYPNFEHIIIDNCSTDETLSVLNKYPHLTVVSEPDEGQSDALNKGFRRATGDIIGWLNADDYYLPGTFETVNTRMEDRAIDGVYSNIYFIDGAGNRTGKVIAHRPNKWLSLFYCFIQSTSFFFRREIIDANILIDKDMEIIMDKEFFSHILFKGYRLDYVNAFFACFRWHDSNKSTPTPETRKKLRREGLEVFNRYSGVTLSESPFSLGLYEMGKQASKVFRVILKTTS